MKHLPHWRSLLLLLLPLTIIASPRNTITTTVLPSLVAPDGVQGVSAPYAGMLEGNILVAGGCNFPDVPAAEGGTKVYYDNIWSYSEQQWTTIGHLPEPLAYGASAQTPNGLVCIGGSNQSGQTNHVYLLTSDGKARPLSSLPTALSNHAATYYDGKIYVAGGESNGQDNMTVWSLDFPDGMAWNEVAVLSGTGRLQPALCVQMDATAPQLCILGGYSTRQADTGQCQVHDDGIIINLKNGRQYTTRPMPAGVTLCGAQCQPIGYSHVLCVGGVDRHIFAEAINRTQPDSLYMLHDPAWYRFRTQALLYHTITRSWMQLPAGERVARAGAAFVSDGTHYYVIGGETKPGIRSTDVTEIRIHGNRSFGWLNWTVLAIYLVAMLGLGYYFMRRENGADDFFKGGGRIPWWAAGISIYATMLSAITYMAIPAKAYGTDWTYYPMLITILVVSFPVIKYYLPFFRRLKVTSAYEYLELRFNALTRLMASALFIIFMIARMALVLYLPSLALSAVTGIDIHTCILLMGLVTIIYCTMGGVEAVVWGDVVQGIILVGGAIFAVIYLMANTEGGFAGSISMALDEGKLRLFDWSLDWRSATFWVVIVGGLANNLISYTSDQTVIQRYLTTKDERSAGRSILMNGIMSAFISVAFYAIGTGLYTYFGTHPDQLDATLTKGDAILPFFMMSQMPAGVAGLLIAAIFAATMSTISSNINSVATAFSIDFYKRFRRTATDNSVVRCARLTCVVSGIVGVGIALLMAEWNILSLLDYFNTILGLLSSGLGGLFVMGIFFRRINGPSALLGFLAGTAAVFYLQFNSECSFLLFGAIGILVSVAVGLVCSLLFRQTRNLEGLTR